MYIVYCFSFKHLNITSLPLDQQKQKENAEAAHKTLQQMAAPIAIGTRGTIGSLVRKEIDYFKNFNTCHPQFDPRRGNSEENTKNSQQRRDRSSSRLSSWFSKTNWRKKKRQSRGGKFLPSMCSAVEVSGENQVPGFNYRILKSDHDKGLRVQE